MHTLQVHRFKDVSLHDYLAFTTKVIQTCAFTESKITVTPLLIVVLTFYSVFNVSDTSSVVLITAEYFQRDNLGTYFPSHF